MPVKKTDKTTTPKAASATKTPKKKPVAKKVSIRTKTPVVPTGSVSISVKRIPTKAVTKKITKAKPSKIKKTPPVVEKAPRRRQTSAEMEQKLSVLLGTKTKNTTPETVVALTLEKTTLEKLRAKASDSLQLPSNMSVRSIKKAEVIRSLFTDDTMKAAEKVAYVSSLCLILFGLFFSFTDDQLLPQSQLAQLSGSLNTTSSTINKTTTSAVPQPTIELTTAIPAEIVDDVQINFVAMNTSGAEVQITSFAGNGAIERITPNPLSDNLYRFTIPGKTLEPGEHRVTIRLRGINNTAITEHNFTFIKPEPLVVNRQVVQTADDSITNATNTATGTQPTSATSTTGSAAAIILQNAAVTEELQILLPQRIVTGISIIGFNAPEDTESIVVYTRNTSTLTPVRIGTANRSKLATNWQFVYDTRVRPDGEYELFAEARQESGAVLRDSETIVISNVINVEKFNITSPTANTVAPETDTEEVASTRDPLPVPRLPREFVPVISSDGSVDLATVDAQNSDEDKIAAVTSLTESILLDNREEIEALYQRYSVAFQSGDEMLMQAIESDIAAAHARYTTRLLTDNSTSYFADDVDRELREQFENMKKRIMAFEEIRRTSSNERSSTDGDDDGVSDFDEENIYFTDSNNPDTDNDGVLDGVEIIRGFSPTDPSSEAIIVYESPKESFGVVRSDVLAVTNVTPVIVTNEAGETMPVQAEIKGKGLPNSFVTIYIFSTPIIVTVKTDENGSFAYTFDKELENGEHEVYVAVTDNTGWIIAQSNPFRFIKEAQAFTPVNGSAPVPAPPAAATTNNPYNITIGLGILALGLVLLMLGVSLRNKREPVIEAQTT